VTLGKRNAARAGEAQIFVVRACMFGAEGASIDTSEALPRAARVAFPGGTGGEPGAGGG
jgi:hypothetical protein